jgi:hypothetical protein
MDTATLTSVLNRIIPADEHTPGGEISLPHVLSLVTPSEAAQATLATFLTSLGDDFVELPTDVQDEVLKLQQDNPVFQHLCEWTHEGYWTSEAGQDAVGFVLTG